MRAVNGKLIIQLEWPYLKLHCYAAIIKLWKYLDAYMASPE